MSHATITRRDFLNGVAFGTGGTIAGGLLPDFMMTALAGGPAPQDADKYYPPTRTGLRGNHPGSFEGAHRLRDGDFWSQAGKIGDTNEAFDLVVVGGGISGLAAAYFYRARHADARILILDNHDDFGGHAKRNEFELGGRLALINGGTMGIDSPRPYSVVADGLLKTLGVDPVALAKKCADRAFYPSLGLRPGSVLRQGNLRRRQARCCHRQTFVAATFGADAFVATGTERYRQDRASGYRLPSRPVVRSKEIPIVEDELSRFLVECRQGGSGRRCLRPGAHPRRMGRRHRRCLGARRVGFGFPGFQGIHLEPGSAPHMGFTAAGYADGGSYTFHFPDGNASIARLLVRHLIPGSVPGDSAEDVVTARLDYSRLDHADASVRIRLNSIVARVRNVGDPSTGVDVQYLRGGEVCTVHARSCVLACYNMMISHPRSELPERQKAALHYAVKIPLIYASVALKNWRPFKTLGIARVYSPGSYFSSLFLNPTVDIGEYRSPRSPDEPTLVQMVRTPVQPGLPEREQHRAGHFDILGTSFATFEHNIRDQLGRILGPGGFDADTDIAAITVNRWPHGYAYEYNPLFDPDWPEGSAPHEIGRARFWPHHHRQLRCRGGGVHGLRD